MGAVPARSAAWSIRHGEALTISDHLTVWGDDGNPVYRPTVHYAYCPSDAAINSVLELRMRNWEMQARQRILNDEIISGARRARRAADGPPVPVVVDRFAAVDRRGAGDRAAPERDHAAGGRLDHRRVTLDDRRTPNEGVRVPDDLPWREVLDVATPYLGTMHSAATDWDPVTTRNDLFPTFANEADLVDRDDPWQFSNFLVV